MGTLDAEQLVEQQVCRFLKLTAPFTGPNMRDDINNVLNEGWKLNTIALINGDYFAVFVRPKKQAG
jgi:hypothetical protein